MGHGGGAESRAGSILTAAVVRSGRTDSTGTQLAKWKFSEVKGFCSKSKSKHRPEQGQECNILNLQAPFSPLLKNKPLINRCYIINV